MSERCYLEIGRRESTTAATAPRPPRPPAHPNYNLDPVAIHISHSCDSASQTVRWHAACRRVFIVAQHHWAISGEPRHLTPAAAPAHVAQIKSLRNNFQNIKIKSLLSIVVTFPNFYGLLKVTTVTSFTLDRAYE
ncbi:hypothetical protein EVAR_47390_1 [Eumeta japonica]|uniref:Uncharacterized protein n=1 Tax=Eumeta variegata TaxID=151549 RepID=A0A4C1WT22_EUMVA|nr:hypothetical protein EVAR_47390_1 [Eumeta japonica]